MFGNIRAISQGGSLEELKQNMKEAIQLSLEYLEDKAKKDTLESWLGLSQFSYGCKVRWG